MYYRLAVIDGGLQRTSRLGDNTNTGMSLTAIATDTAQTLTAAQMAGGAVQFTSFTAGRAVTTDTAVNILALYPAMDIGDQMWLLVSAQAAFAATWAAGTGVTLAGRATTPASSSTWICITKTAAATCTWTVL